LLHHFDKIELPGSYEFIEIYPLLDLGLIDALDILIDLVEHFIVEIGYYI